MKNLLITLFIFVLSSPSFAWEGMFIGELRFEGLLYKNDKDTKTYDRDFSLYTLSGYEGEGDLFKIKLQALGRVALFDDDRNIVSPQDVFLEIDPKSFWRFKGGYQILNWSATEAFHPADIINSRNLDSNAEKTEKLGEMTVELELATPLGWFNFYYLPVITEPKYPGERSRRGGVDIRNAEFFKDQESSLDGKFTPQYAIRYNKSFSDFDISFHTVRHMDRHQPLLVPEVTDFGVYKVLNPLVITPHYYMVTQYGGTLQWILDWVVEGLLLKFEGAIRDFDEYDPVYTIYDDLLNTSAPSRTPLDHAQWAWSLERTLEVFSAHELTWIIEMQVFTGVDEEERSQLSVFQNDLLIGARYLLNDVDGSEFFASYIYDLERKPEVILNFSYSRRLSDTWKAKWGLRMIEADGDGSLIGGGLTAVDEDHSVYMDLSRFF